MTTYHVGGWNPIHRTKTLQEAVDKASYDDVIEIHKRIEESVTLSKPLQIKGHGNHWVVPAGRVGLVVNDTTIIEDLCLDVHSRANGMVLNADTVLNRVTVQMVGPIVAFYPAIWLKSGTLKCQQGKLTKVQTEEGTKTELEDTILYSYYGENVETNGRSETSFFSGDVDSIGGSIASATFYNVIMKNTIIRQFVRIQDGVLMRTTLSLEPPEGLASLQVSKRQLKKEPTHGPLQDQTGNHYHCYITGNAKIQHYMVNASCNKETIGFYGNGANLTVYDSNHPQNKIRHHLIKSSIAFKDSKDENYWYVDDTLLQCVRSHVNTNSTQRSAMDQIDELVGLTNVKKQLHTLMNTIQMGENKGFSNHMIFAGNPGTGKSTVAELVAQALFEIGAIPQNKCTVVTSAQLVQGYVGQTGQHVTKVLDEAMGGVLFIDEAYQLTIKDGERSFNGDVLEPLIQYMEKYRDELVVIAAGYTKEMRQFLASNVGLARRFQWIEFEDYNADEMAQIFELMRKAHGDQYASDVNPRMIAQLFEKLIELNLARPDANGRVTNGGNGGLVRNVYQRITLAKNNRFTEHGGDLTIQKDDIINGFKEEMQQTLHKTGD